MATFGGGAIGTGQIADNSITKVKLADDAVSAAEIENDSIVNADINSAAAIVGSKLQALSVGANAGVIPSTGVADSHIASAGLTNTAIAAAAAIAPTKLATITTAGKVDGAALTGLASIPGGAGLIPAANLPAQTEDQFSYNAEMIRIISGATRVMSGELSSLPCIRCGAGVVSELGLGVRVPQSMTSISAIKIAYKPTVGGSNVILDRNKIANLPVSGAADVTDNDLATETLTVGATAGRLYEYTLPAARYSSIASVAAGDVLGIYLRFLRSDAGDTNTGSIDIAAILIDFA